MSVTKIRRWDP